MLRELTFKQFLELREYDRISPIGDRRGDWQAAAICALLANLAATRGHSRKRFKVKDFLLEFGDEKIAPRQTWQEQKMIAQMVAIALTEPDKKRKR